SYGGGESSLKTPPFFSGCTADSSTSKYPLLKGKTCGKSVHHGVNHLRLLEASRLLTRNKRDSTSYQKNPGSQWVTKPVPKHRGVPGLTPAGGWATHGKNHHPIAGSFHAAWRRHSALVFPL
ncbi:60S ribosomal protein L15, partial [Galemys pyrenaicus]